VKREPEKQLDLEKFEIVLDELLINYRNAIRAAECLPGTIPSDEFILEPAQNKGKSKKPGGDWYHSRRAIGSIAKIFVKSHVRHNLSIIADKLEVERLAKRDLGSDNQKRLDNIIRELKDFENRLSPKRPGWWKSLGWIWAIVAPVVVLLIQGWIVSTHHITPSLILINIAIGVMLLAILIYIPLYCWGALWGYRWKRLILVGQTGDINAEFESSAVLRWLGAPRANTYQSENQLYEVLGLPKPLEFPWDMAFSPLTVMGLASLLAFFLFGLAWLIPQKNFSWIDLVPTVLILISIYSVPWSLRLIRRAKQKRLTRNTG
jgi:hypothetical protein